MRYENISLEVENGIGYLTLNRPENANSINVGMAKDLMHAMLECEQNPGLRSILITGAGKLFCAGGDLKSFWAQGGDGLPVKLREATSYLHPAVLSMTKIGVPLVAAVHGSAAGAGLSLVCASDIVLCADSARFTLAYTRAGLSPDAGATYFLPRLIGRRRALDLAFNNRVISAQEALKWGIVTYVVPERELFYEAKKIASRLAAGATRAFGATKRLLNKSYDESLESQLENESLMISETGGTTDAREGIGAFLAKKTPVFKGE